MAFILPFETASGATGDYWKVMEVVIDYYYRRSRVSIGLFKDQASRLEGKTPMNVLSFELVGEKFPFGSGDNPRAAAYVVLKGMPEFVEARDALTPEDD